MKHRIGFNRLGRKYAHRKSMERNMVISLLRYERIRTTRAKALQVRRIAEKLITRARQDSVHNRRIAGRLVHDAQVLNKLFTDVGPRFVQRPGGYTRILKLGQRPRDAAEVVILELVERKKRERKRKKKESEST